MSVNEVVPFFAIKDMEASLAFYIEGLGFEMKNKWVKEGKIRWCRFVLAFQSPTDTPEGTALGDINT